MVYPITAVKLHKVFKSGLKGTRVTALKELSLAVEAGEVFGLLGPNGAGKTTAIKIFMGLIYPTSGRAEILGRAPWDVRVKGRIGFLPEGPYFYDYLTGVEFLDFYGRLFGLGHGERRRRIEEILTLVGLADFNHMKLREYSKGMLQRIGLAQALINDPEVIVLDEPMSGLDPVGRKELSDIIMGLKDRGKTVFFSSHILSDAERICDRVAVLNKGILVYIGRVRDFVGTQPRFYEVTLEGPSPELTHKIRQLAQALKEAEGQVVVRLEKADEVEWLLKETSGQGGRVCSVVPVYPTLEELFMRLVG